MLEGSYDFSCDVWSLGVLLYVMLSGYPPFYGDTDPEIIQSVREGVFDFDGIYIYIYNIYIYIYILYRGRMGGCIRSSKILYMQDDCPTKR